MRWPIVLLVAGCGSKGVTSGRLEAAVAPTFANLIHTQEAALGATAIDPASLRASARCHKADPAAGKQGGGSWVCTITWHSPRRPLVPLVDTYDVAVTMDGCYTATADSAEAHVGGPTLMTRDGSMVPNLVYAFDGCFDTT
jgi:hypothetical protein